ncbi:MAG: hypothetical protein LE178_01995 [Endomicrobium sp.]|nr:hypothetical protein [Endomicrobium sp.]
MKKTNNKKLKPSLPRISKKENKTSDFFAVSEQQENYIVSREIEDETKKAKLGFNKLTPTEWALLSKNVITEDDILNPVWNNLSHYYWSNCNNCRINLFEKVMKK